VALRHGGDGDRVPLALVDSLTPGDVEAIAAKLAKMDAKKPWTRETLALIGKHPRIAASTLAAKVGRETPEFKADVVKLKKLGLTPELRGRLCLVSGGFDGSKSVCATAEDTGGASSGNAARGFDLVAPSLPISSSASWAGRKHEPPRTAEAMKGVSRALARASRPIRGSPDEP
jgi:hypothetical protein